MKKRLSLAGIFFLLISISTACDKSNDEPFDEPIDAPFTEYSLEGTSCRWTNFNGSHYNSELIMINNDKELRKYITSITSDYDYPAIDFSKHTLLLARGVEGHNVSVRNVDLQQSSTRSYAMTVNLQGSLVSVITYWQAPILISRLKVGGSVVLFVTKD